MTDLKRLRERLELHAEDGGDGAPICSTCNRAYSMAGDDEPTPMCNSCAHEFIATEAPALLDELERLRARCEELRFRMLCSVHQEPGIVSCACCWKRWDDGAPERHDVACIAAPDGATE